jgi:hypothetical protein
VLAIGVELDGAVVTLLHRIAEARAECSADTEVERQGHHRHASLRSHGRSGVFRPVVDDQHVEVRHLCR